MYNFFSKYKVFPTFVTAFWHTQMKLLKSIFIISVSALQLILLSGGVVFSQDKQSDLQKKSGQKVSALELSADSLMRSYQFSRAKDIYKNILKTESVTDVRGRLESKAIICENGESMLNYVSEPKVVEKNIFSKNDFFLHYPGLAREGAFVESPLGLSAKKDTIYFPSNTSTLYFSAADARGTWNIYMTKRGDNNIWSAPKVLNDNITSSGNEIFPYVTADGKKLYFSSNGHYGAGGYDLYVSEWDDQTGDWGTAQNMGFPYSSPSDDLFFYNTPDGKYSVFASSRATDNPAKSSYAPDKITVYVLAFEPVPVKHQATAEEALEISKLRNGKTQEARDSANAKTVSNQLKHVDGSPAVKTDSLTQAATANYSRISAQYRSLQKSINQAIARQKKNRELYTALQNRIGGNSADSVLLARRKDSLTILVQKISEEERNTLDLQDKADKAAKSLRKIEENFLSNGMVVPAAKPQDTTSTSSAARPAAAATESLFEQNAVQQAPAMKIEKVAPEKDLSFRVGTLWLAQQADIPEGLVYQIRFLQLAKQATPKSLKGLSPVFENKTGSKYSYCVGVFYSYSDAYDKLSRIKKMGFPSAAVVALNNREPIALQTAKKLESKMTAVSYNVIISGYDNSLPEDLLKVLKDNTQKDIAKVSGNFIIGPFTRQTEANALAEKLKKVSDKDITVEKVK